MKTKKGNIILRLLTWVVGLALLVLIIAYLAGVFRPKVEPGKVAEPEAAAPAFAKIEAVQARTEPLVERIPGTLSALRDSMISSRIMARIESIAVRAGDTVRAGQALVKLDSRDLSARVTQAEQAVTAARARLADAENEYQRLEKLVKQGIVAQSEFDTAQSAYDAAKADVARAVAAQSEAGTGQAFASIDAPFAGRIVDRYAEPGDTAMPGQPLLKIYDPSRMRLETYVRESLAATLKPGVPLAVQIDAPNTTLAGKVEEIVPQSDPGSRTVLVKVALPQRDDLYPGMFGRLVIPAGTARRLYVPESAVVRVGQLTEAWVIDADQRAARRMIKLGSEQQDGLVEVISGLDAGERVGDLATTASALRADGNRM